MSHHHKAYHPCRYRPCVLIGVFHLLILVKEFYVECLCEDLAVMMGIWPLDKPSVRCDEFKRPCVFSACELLAFSLLAGNAGQGKIIAADFYPQPEYVMHLFLCLFLCRESSMPFIPQEFPRPYERHRVLEFPSHYIVPLVEPQ